jgi:hypothetical protein
MDKEVNTFINKLLCAVVTINLTHLHVIYNFINNFLNFDRLCSLKVLCLNDSGAFRPEEKGTNYPNIRLLLSVRMEIISPTILNLQA